MLQFCVDRDVKTSPRVLKRFIAGDQSHDNTVLTAITVRNYGSLFCPFLLLMSFLFLLLGTERGHSNGTDHELSLQRPLFLH
jgi:hypothetical protein